MKIHFINDLSKLTTEEIVENIITIMADYVDEMYNSVTSKCKMPGKGISARFSTSSYGDFYMDYSCLYPTYSKEDAKQALNIFKKYANIISEQLDTIKSMYPELEYEITKTIMSSAKIGRGLYVYNFPYKLPDEHYER